MFSTSFIQAWNFQGLARRGGWVALFIMIAVPVAWGRTLHFKEPSIFFDNFEVISEGKPGFTVEGNYLLRMANEVETPQHLFAVYSGSEISAGEAERVAATFNRLRIPKQANDKRDFGLALMVNSTQDRCYYARLLFDLSTLEIGIINPQTGRGWVSLVTIELEGGKDGDRLIFEWEPQGDGKGVLKASIINPNETIVASVQTERNLVEDGFEEQGVGRVGIGLFGWPSSTVALSKIEVRE